MKSRPSTKQHPKKNSSKPIKPPRRHFSNSKRPSLKHKHYDAVIVGAGIAGAAAAIGVTTPSLALPPTTKDLILSNPTARVLVIDTESDFCFHSTGRSAAIYSEIYGSPSVQVLSTATKPFYFDPVGTGLLKDGPASEGLGNDALVKRRGSLWVATSSEVDELNELYNSAKSLVPTLKMLTVDQLHQMVPATALSAATESFDYDDSLADDFGQDHGDYKPALAMLEADAADMDVNSIWASMTRVAKANGAEFIKQTKIITASHKTKSQSQSKAWELQIADSRNSSELPYTITSDLIINASGAWADHTASLLGASQRKLQPKQRTIIQFPPTDIPQHILSQYNTTNPLSSFDSWPAIFDFKDRFYYKPDGGRVLASPCDEVNVDAADVQPDEIAMALCIERLKQSSFFDPSHIMHKWAGLRTFAPDREFVLGYDGINKHNGHGYGQDMLWVAGLGGYGIQTAFGNARVVSSLVHNNKLPHDMILHGLEPEQIDPQRSILF